MMTVSHPASLPAGFAPDSRVWIYQADRPFTPQEALRIEPLLQGFVGSWRSHGTPVKGYADIFYDQFIVLMVDETGSGISGCSTDSSVHLIKQIEQETDTRLFDRLNLAFYIEGKVKLVTVAQLASALESGLVRADTLYFNNVVQTKEELETKWLISLKNSWLGDRYLRTSGVTAAGA
jgi:hypothetical protein